jgi:hypothetical protein
MWCNGAYRSLSYALSAMMNFTEKVLECCIPGFTWNVLYYFNFFTAMVHASSAIIILVLTINLDVSSNSESSKDVMNHINQSVPIIDGPYFPGICLFNVSNNTRPEMTIQPEQIFDVRVYFGVLITIFFALSAIFQAGQGIFATTYKTRVESNDVNFIRYIEYSLSASVMMVAIACSLSVFDIYTHFLVFTCSWLCMMLGLVVDYLRMLECNLRWKSIYEVTQIDWSTILDDISRLKWFTHYLGWVAIFSPYFSVFFSAYSRVLLNSSACLKDLPSIADIIPTFVHVIVLSQLLLFSSFGIVQSLQLVDNPKDTEGNDMLHPKNHTQTLAQNDNIQKLPSEPMSDIHQGLTDETTLLASGQTMKDVIIMYERETMRIGIKTEVRFVTLSLIAKSLLGWLIASNLLFG